MRIEKFPAFAICLVVFLVYLQTYSFEFLRFDDQDYTFLCPFVKDGLSWANVKSAFCSFRHAAIWMPFTYISYMFDISLFGSGMGMHHFVNAAIHTVNSVLFYWLLMGIFGRTKNGVVIALLSTLLWALHPMRVEPVAWIAGRKELLCAFFVLLGLLAVSNLKSQILIFLCCIAACMSKPTGMCFPFLALCVAAMVRTGKSSILKSQFLTLPVAVITGLIAIYSQTHAEGYDVRTLFTAPFSVRILNAFKSLGLYLFKSVFPFNLHIDCRWPTPNLPADGWGTILAAVAGLVLMGFWLISALRDWKTAGQEDNRTKGVLLFFFLFAIVPTLGIFGSFGREARADRFMYIPSMAFSMLLAATLRVRNGELKITGMTGQEDNRTIRHARIGKFSILLFLVIVYAIGTFALIPTFRNDYTAFSRVLACDPVHPRALSHVASEECARFKDFDSGIRHFRDSLACEWNRDTACQLAFALATRGRKEDISDIRALGESTGIARNPESDRKALMAEALGMAALKERRWRDAVKFFSAAVRAPSRLYPPHDAFARLGVALANGGNLKEAEAVFSALARPGAARESVRAFAERALEQIASSQGGRIMLFY